MIVAFTPPSVCLWHVKKDVIHAWIVHCWNVSCRIVYCEIGQSANVLYSEKILLHCFYVFGHLEFFLAVNLYKNMWKQYSSDRLWMFSKIFSKSFVWHLDQKKVVICFQIWISVIQNVILSFFSCMQWFFSMSLKQNSPNSKQGIFLETNCLTVGKIKFYFSAINCAKQSYFAFMNKLNSTPNESKDSFIVQWLHCSNNFCTWYKVNTAFLSVIL